MFQGWCNLIRYRILHKHIRQYSRTHKRNAFLLEGAHSTSFSASNCSVPSQRIHTQTRQPLNPQGELDARVWIFRTGFHDPDFQQQAKHFRSSHSMKHALHEALDRLRQMTTVHDPGHNALLVQFCGRSTVIWIEITETRARFSGDKHSCYVVGFLGPCPLLCVLWRCHPYALQGVPLGPVVTRSSASLAHIATNRSL